ncbi:NAD(P)H-dependent oxidoreductase [Phyllobacterium sp. YR531]|uniref:FMN-dependent NADH-azoreductase n=1 Tax=Phyllobacterium sp. YR531 TaxID=1144343 RepID=UPI00026FA0F4|nr:NAD(P)H-dependent oxidoreductase [Phyllobacterium sp. YR531]EJN05943.1 acyl carrier protein phosphodiesterase [Phyllobacterium sp. YR531]
MSENSDVDKKSMKKVLFINSTPKPMENSITLQMAHNFIENYKSVNPYDEISTLNLYEENIRFLDLDNLNQMFSKDPEKIDFVHYTKQFVEADRYIIAAPMWNLTVPAILSAYLDYANVQGLTFYYTATGAVGMLGGKGKKAVLISSRGGGYSEGKWEPFEMAERYVRKQFEFLGITDFQLVLMDWADVLQGDELDRAKKLSMENASKAGQNF